MAEFYQKFLNDHKAIHRSYNAEWYKKNIENLILAFRVWLQSLYLKKT